MSEVAVLARRLLALCQARGLMLATAESCTGGLVSAALTAIPGSSAVMDRAFVTYSNEAKQEMLGVPAATIERFGAVSKETALAMAAGALAHSRAGLAVSVTGIAGPGGGSPEKPVGLVWFGVAVADDAPMAVSHRFGPLEREEIRRRAVEAALRQAVESLQRLQAEGGAAP